MKKIILWDIENIPFSHYQYFEKKIDFYNKKIVVSKQNIRNATKNKLIEWGYEIIFSKTIADDKIKEILRDSFEEFDEFTLISSDRDFYEVINKIKQTKKVKLICGKNLSTKYLLKLNIPDNNLNIFKYNASIKNKKKVTKNTQEVMSKTQKKKLNKIIKSKTPELNEVKGVSNNSLINQIIENANINNIDIFEHKMINIEESFTPILSDKLNTLIDSNSVLQIKKEYKCSRKLNPLEQSILDSINQKENVSLFVFKDTISKESFNELYEKLYNSKKRKKGFAVCHKCGSQKYGKYAVEDIFLCKHCNKIFNYGLLTNKFNLKEKFIIRMNYYINNKIIFNKEELVNFNFFVKDDFEILEMSVGYKDMIKYSDYIVKKKKR